MKMREAAFARAGALRTLFINDSLFRNATYLMASTAIMSLLGFVFWVFVAHLYSPANIGIASALISIASLISNFSLLGLNAGLIRFLSSSKQPSKDINAAGLTVAGVTIFAATVYVLFGSHLGAGISLLDSTWHKVAFVVLMVSVTLNSLTDAVFIANRRGEYHTTGYATFAIVKLIFPLILVPFGATGIFGAYILAMIVSVIVSYYLMRRGCNYRLLTKPDWQLLRQMRSYTFHNYFAVVLAGLPGQLMPLFIIHNLGAAPVAFFAMASTMANLLYVIPSAATQSLLAESSYDPGKLSEHLKRIIRLLAFLLVPVVSVAVVASPYLLDIFGSQYRQNSTQIFQIFAIATFSVAINSVGNTILNIEKHTRSIVAIQFVTLVVTATTVTVLIRFGLLGVSLSFLLGNITASLIHVFLWLSRKQISTIHAFPNDAELSTMLHVYNISEYTATPLGNGSNNRTVLVHTAGRQFVLRIYRPYAHKDISIEREIDFTAYIARHGLPVPRIITNSKGKKLSHSDMAEMRWQYILMEFVPGSHPIVYNKNLLTHMARLQAQLHRNGILYALAVHRITRQYGLKQKHHKERIIRALVPQGISHFDYDSTNLLVDNKGNITSILDFEGLRYGPLVVCIYFSLTCIYDKRHNKAMLRYYLAIYQQTRKLRSLEKFLLRLSLVMRYKELAFLRIM
jgi:O-antigen/teichoic acid export membrane protein/aminoglycoside phosphotransferase (APT) family kinase protein